VTRHWLSLPKETIIVVNERWKRAKINLQMEAREKSIQVFLYCDMLEAD
jgi:hypothetical protein